MTAQAWIGDFLEHGLVQAKIFIEVALSSVGARCVVTAAPRLPCTPCTCFQLEIASTAPTPKYGMQSWETMPQHASLGIRLLLSSFRRSSSSLSLIYQLTKCCTCSASFNKQLHDDNMVFFWSSYKFGSSPSRTIATSQDEDGGPDSHVSKALLADENDDGSAESPPPYRLKHGRTVGFTGFAAGVATSALLFGLLALLFFWHTNTLDAGNDGSGVPGMLQSSNMTPKTSIILEDPETLESEMDPSLFAGWKDCGTNVEEAHAKGCFFDIMLHSWVHEECWDKELMDEYLTRVPYHWYRDTHFKEEITVEEMRLGEHGTAAVKLEEHGTHCAYVLEKNLRAIMNGKSVARSIYSVKHAVHCLGLLVDPSKIPGFFTQVAVEYDQCGIPHFD